MDFETMDKFWTSALAIGGLGAIGAFVFWSLYRGWLKLGIFKQLSSVQTFRLMVIFLGLTFSFCTIALVGFLVANKGESHTSIAPPFDVSALKNASYSLFNDVITLQDGKREWGTEVTSDGYVIVKLVDWAFGDLDGNGSRDAVAVVTDNGGGTGTSVTVFPVINDNGSPKPLVSGFPLTQNTTVRSITIYDKIASVQYLTRGPDDPNCCPSVLTTINLALHNDRFECADDQCTKLTQGSS